jgi:hypothetical protein
MAMVTLISAALKEGKLDTDMPVCSIQENKEKILVIIVRYLKRTGRGLIHTHRVCLVQW